jgi:serine/threonine-protein kinase
MARTLAPGEIIDRYTVLSLLGEGGMAAVYAVRHNTLGSRHALKLLKIENEGIQRRLVAEGQVQASLRHPNIVSVTDVLIVDGQIGLLMEHIDGPALDAWLREHRPSQKDALALFRGILAGVSRAHRAGLVHRDLKPGNVLLDSADGLTIPKVADFGLAKILADNEGGHSRTRSGLPMGTPQFMAPEQIRSAKEVDTRADIFALGCILYVLICGQVPFEDPDLLELFNKIATGRYTPPSALVRGLDPRVDATLRACLEFDRERRPPDCEAVRRMLYGDDEAMTGGVKLSPSPPPSSLLRAAPLEQGVTETLMEASARTAAEGAQGSARGPLREADPAAEARGRRDRFGLTVGVVAVFGVLLLALFTAVAGGLAWVGYESRLREAELARQVAAEARTEPALAAPAPSEPAAEVNAAPEVEPPPPTEPRGRAAPAASAASAAPAAPATGTVSVTGRVEAVSLVSSAGRFGPGAVPSGAYAVTYTFAGREPQKLGTVVVEPGRLTTIACDQSFSICRVQ